MTSVLEHHNLTRGIIRTKGTTMNFLFAYTGSDIGISEKRLALSTTLKQRLEGITFKWRWGSNCGLHNDPAQEFSHIEVHFNPSVSSDVLKATFDAILEVFPDAIRAPESDFVMIPVTEVKPENFA